MFNKKEFMQKLGKSSKTHGMTGTKIYNVWSAMKRRCQNPHTKFYRCYGGRGIKVCEEWQKFEPFYEWAKENGYFDIERPSIERIDVNGNYCPQNCKIIPLKMQARNTRVNVYSNGKLLIDISKETGIDIKCLYERHRKGYSHEDLIKPVDHQEYADKMVGKQFGYLTVLRKLTLQERKDLGIKGGSNRCECLCKCGKITYPKCADILKGITQSCGCLHKEKLRQRCITQNKLKGRL